MISSITFFEVVFDYSSVAILMQAYNFWQIHSPSYRNDENGTGTGLRTALHSHLPVVSISITQLPIQHDCYGKMWLYMTPTMQNNPVNGEQKP